MSLHTLSRVTIGVPDVESTAAYYEDFGLRRLPATASAVEARLATADGGDQLSVVHAERRRLIALEVGVDDHDDIERIAANLAGLGVTAHRTGAALLTTDPGTEVDVRVTVTSRIVQTPVTLPRYNAPGRLERNALRAPAVLRENTVRPRKLGHVVIGSTDQPASESFFVDGLGFKVSDRIAGAASFMRCSTDHHNVLVQAAPISMLHHTSWQVDDVDEVGRGATAMLEKDPARHVWGLGRHHIGSNFFWYLRDPAGNFSEYYSDLDCIVDDALWTPQDWSGSRALYNWGPPPLASFLAPDDLAGLMTGSHSGSAL